MSYVRGGNHRRLAHRHRHSPRHRPDSTLRVRLAAGVGTVLVMLMPLTVPERRDPPVTPERAAHLSVPSAGRN